MTLLRSITLTFVCLSPAVIAQRVPAQKPCSGCDNMPSLTQAELPPARKGAPTRRIQDLPDNTPMPVASSGSVVSNGALDTDKSVLMNGAPADPGRRLAADEAAFRRNFDRDLKSGAIGRGNQARYAAPVRSLHAAIRAMSSAPPESVNDRSRASLRQAQRAARSIDQFVNTARFRPETASAWKRVRSDLATWNR